MTMISTDLAWDNFVDSNYTHLGVGPAIVGPAEEHKVPKPSDIYISTKTKIAYLDSPIDLKATFWKVPIIPYETPKCGVIKKQIKVSCMSRTEVVELEKRIAATPMTSVDILSQVDNPTARRLKFKDVRKINVGLAKKDLISYRARKKGAFYNCFVVILRILGDDEYREVHVKVFNTGKLEIPGIKTDDHLTSALELLCSTLTEICGKSINYNAAKIDTVLINSNFSANFYIERHLLSNILKYKYGIHVVYDPCSYPGIQCKFFYNEDQLEGDGVCRCPEPCWDRKGNGKGEGQCMEVSFMIFRTGSVLIVGHCDEHVLRVIYKFILRILGAEFSEIHIKGYDAEAGKKKKKGKKPRRKVILVRKQPVDES